MNTISIHAFLTRIDFRQVAFIQPASSCNSLGGHYSLSAAANSAINFIGSSTLVTEQSPDYFRDLARGRVLSIVASEEIRLVPLDAIHHLEIVTGEADESKRSDEDRQDGEQPEARIIYRAYDPACPEQRFQMSMPARIIDDLLDNDQAGVIDIGRGKFVFADAVEDARPLKPRQIAKLAQGRSAEDAPCEPSVSIVQLRGGDFIPSSFPAYAIEGMVGRALPSAGVLRSRCGVDHSVGAV